MKKAGFLVLLTVLWVWRPEQVRAQSPAFDFQATLYSSIKHRGERVRRCVNLHGRTPALKDGKADLCYGSMYVSSYLDWFDSVDPDRRTVVKDLGLLNWGDRFHIPILQPRAALREGEHRQLSVDASGKAGADGRDGADGANGIDGRADFRVNQEPGDIPGPPLAIPEASRPQGRKHDGKPKVDPFWTKAVLGHLYVIHVVDQAADFYALFRVDSLVAGDSCTISWRVIPNPATQTSSRE